MKTAMQELIESLKQDEISEQNNNSIQDQYGNSSKPLLVAVCGSNIKCTCCPECGCKEYVNKNLVGDGYRMCRECHQDWWIDIKYDSPYCH